jgi:phage shock protein A
MEYSQLQAILASNIHAQNIAEKDYKEAQAEAKRWEKRYQLALKAGRENLIQEAQFHQNLYAKKQYNLKLMLDEQTARVASLRQTLSHLKLKPYHTKSLDKISQQYETPSENLITKLCKVEGKIEDINNELLIQQDNIKKLLMLMLG